MRTIAKLLPSPHSIQTVPKGITLISTWSATEFKNGMWENSSRQRKGTNVQVMVDGGSHTHHVTCVVSCKRQKGWQTQKGQGDFKVCLLCLFISADFLFSPQPPHFQPKTLSSQRPHYPEGLQVRKLIKDFWSPFSWWSVPSYRPYLTTNSQNCSHGRHSHFEFPTLLSWFLSKLQARNSVKIYLLSTYAAKHCGKESCNHGERRATANPWSPTLATPFVLPITSQLTSTKIVNIHLSP